MARQRRDTPASVREMGLPETGGGTASGPAPPVEPPVVVAPAPMPKMPDLTPAQGLAAVIWFVSQLIGLGVVDSRTSKIVITVSATVLAAAWFLADAFIRYGRSRALGVQQSAPTVERARSL